MNSSIKTHRQTKTRLIKPKGKIFLVGGYLRDKMLKIESGDKDWLVVGSNPTEMKSLGFRQVGKDFPVFINPLTNEEYALARKETKTGEGYGGFSCEFENVSLVDDLARRDITINAMALGVVDHNNFVIDGDFKEKLVDPFFGEKDLKNKVIRHTSDAFCEDPLRVIRVARFYAKLYHLGFSIHSDTKKLLVNMVKKGEIQHLTKERIWREVEKLVYTKNPEVFFLFLAEIGGLEVIFPHFSNCLNSNLFKAIALIYQQRLLKNHSSLIRLGVCFFDYENKNKLADWFSLSSDQRKLFKILDSFQSQFNEFLEFKNNKNTQKEQADFLCEFFTNFGVLKEKSFIDEFLMIQMLIHNLDLSSKPIYKFVHCLYAYLSVNISDFLKKNKAKFNANKNENILEKIKQLRVNAILNALEKENLH